MDDLARHRIQAAIEQLSLIDRRTAARYAARTGDDENLGRNDAGDFAESFLNRFEADDEMRSALYSLIGAARYDTIRRIPGFHTLTRFEVQGTDGDN